MGDVPLMQKVDPRVFDGDVELGKRTLGRIAPQERIGQPKEVGEAVGRTAKGMAVAIVMAKFVAPVLEAIAVKANQNVYHRPKHMP